MDWYITINVLSTFVMDEWNIVGYFFKLKHPSGPNDKQTGTMSALTCHRCCSGSRCAAVCLWSSWSSGQTLSQPHDADSTSYRAEPDPSWPPCAHATTEEHKGWVKKHANKGVSNAFVKERVLVAWFYVLPFCLKSFHAQSPGAGH